MIKNPVIDIVKGLAIILVVYAHVIQRVMVLAQDDFFSHLVFKIIYTFHMPVFFLISGFLISSSLSRKSIDEVFKSRCQTLLFPYFTWGTLGVLTFWVLNSVDGKSESFDFWSQWLNQLIIDPEIWFLSTLFLCAVFLLLSVYLHKRSGLAVFAAIYFLLLLFPDHQMGSLYYVKWFYVFYAAGYFINQYGLGLLNRLNKKIFIPVVLLVYVMLASVWTIQDYIYVNQMSFLSKGLWLEYAKWIYRYSVGFLGIALLCWGAAYLVRFSSMRFLEILGIYSLDIYLLQRYLVEGLFPRLLSKANVSLDAHSPYFILGWAPVITAVSLVMCWAVSKYLIRRHTLTSMVFLGRRA